MQDAKHGSSAHPQRVAVIDFELAGQDNIYRDFVPFAASTAMPWDFWRRVIKYYNAIENKKYPISINPEKVKNALIYGATHEFSRVLNHQKQEGKDINIGERAEFLRRRLDYLIGIDELFDSGAVTKKTDAWGRAAIKVAKKDNHITAAVRVKNMHDKGAEH